MKVRVPGLMIFCLLFQMKFWRGQSCMPDGAGLALYGIAAEQKRVS